MGAGAMLIHLKCALTMTMIVFGDGGYSDVRIDWTLAMFGWTMEVVERTEKHKFVLLPKRWILDLTLA